MAIFISYILIYKHLKKHKKVSRSYLKKRVLLKFASGFADKVFACLEGEKDAEKGGGKKGNTRLREFGCFGRKRQ